MFSYLFKSHAFQRTPHFPFYGGWLAKNELKLEDQTLISFNFRRMFGESAVGYQELFPVHLMIFFSELLVIFSFSVGFRIC